MTHIYVNKSTIIGSENGLAPRRCQDNIWSNAGILFIGPLETNFRGILIEIHTFSFKKKHFKMSSGKCQPFFSASMCKQTCLVICSVRDQKQSRQISWSLEAARLDVIVIVSLWNLTGTLTVRLQKFNPVSLNFETSRDLAVKRPSA